MVSSVFDQFEILFSTKGDREFGHLVNYLSTTPSGFGPWFLSSLLQMAFQMSPKVQYTSAFYIKHAFLKVPKSQLVWV